MEWFARATLLYYYRARYYSTSLGRFLQTDPIGARDDLNLYAYVGNNPLNATDPTGLEEKKHADTDTAKQEKSVGCKQAGAGCQISHPNGTPSERRQSSATLRKKWEAETGQPWPKDGKTGRNQDVAHREAVADGGSPNDPKNYRPQAHDEHMQEYSDKGDFKRWGARSQQNKPPETGTSSGVPKGGRVIRGGGGVIGAALGVLGAMDLHEALEKYPDLPFGVGMGILGGMITMGDVDAYYAAQPLGCGDCEA